MHDGIHVIGTHRQFAARVECLGKFEPALRIGCQTAGCIESLWQKFAESSGNTFAWKAHERPKTPDTHAFEHIEMHMCFVDHMQGQIGQYRSHILWMCCNTQHGARTGIGFRVVQRQPLCGTCSAAAGHGDGVRRLPAEISPALFKPAQKSLVTTPQTQAGLYLHQQQRVAAGNGDAWRELHGPAGHALRGLLR